VTGSGGTGTLAYTGSAFSCEKSANLDKKIPLFPIGGGGGGVAWFSNKNNSGIFFDFFCSI
jgi:hypothetical protein